MNAAGNADGGRSGSRNGTYTQVALVLSAWFIIFSLILMSRTIGSYLTPNNREIYDTLSLSALIVFIATVLVNSLLRLETPAATALSSILLATTYYARLVQILLTKGGSIVVLPLFDIIRFESMKAGSISLDLGQIGILTLLYSLMKSPILRGILKYPLKR